MLKNVIQSSSPISWLLGMSSVMGGGAVAMLTGNFEFLPFSLCLIFIILFQAAANLFHRYAYISRHTGEEVEHYMQWTDPQLSDEKTLMREGATTIGMLAVMIGMALTTMGGLWVLGVGLFTLAVVYFNSFGPKPICESPVNYLMCVIMFGPVAVVTTLMIQVLHNAAHTPAWHNILPGLMMGFIMGIRISNAQILYNYSNYEQDKHYGKRTIAVFLGRKGTRIVYFGTTVLAFVLATVASLVFRIGPWWLPIVVSALETSFHIYIGTKLQEFNQANMFHYQNIFNWSVFILSLAYFITFAVCGAADTRTFDYF